MDFMITATFKGNDVRGIPKPAKDDLLKLPEGVECIDAWIGMDGYRHFQVLRTDDESLVREWMEPLSALIDFDVDPVDHVPSSEVDAMMQSVEQLALACRMYASDNNGMLPSAMDDLQPYMGESHDPSAFVLEASGNILETDEAKDSSKEVLVRQKGSLRVMAFVDGHAELVSMPE